MMDDPGGTHSKSTILSRRMFMLSGAKIVIFAGIFYRLFDLQISQNIKYLSLSDRNRLREWKLAPQRGVIEDYFGTIIADNNQVFQLHMIPEDVTNFNLLFFRLSKMMNLSDVKIAKLKKKIKSQKAWEPIIISDNLTWTEFSKLNLYLHEISGVKPVVSLARKYPSDGSFSHIIGYVSEASASDLKKNKFLKDIYVPGLRIGKTGLEKHLNEVITGSPGYQRYEVNVYGKKVREVKVVSGGAGKSFRTTLDSNIQTYATELLKGKAGAICVMDIYTGDMIAMASSPTFDANKFVYRLNEEDWQKLITNKRKPLMNKTVSALYPPGSTIKPLVVLSALDNDVISPKLVVECKGKIEFYGQTYHCWKEKGHGFMGLRNAVKQSCDIYFYEVARRLGIDRLSETAKSFGFGSKTLDILSEEKAGVVPNTKWKLKNIGKGWVLGETLISGIGQGYFQTTPIQICLMMAQLANGGYAIKPRIINDEDSLKPTVDAWREKFTYENSDLDIDIDNVGLKKLYRNKENVKFVLDSLYGATNEVMGTSYASRHRKGKYLYAGKTGTSQIRTITLEERELKLKNKDLPYEKRDHSLFTAFAPYKNPRYALSIVIEHGGPGSSGAAPIAKKLIKRILDRHQERKKYQPDLFLEI